MIILTRLCYKRNGYQKFMKKKFTEVLMALVLSLGILTGCGDPADTSQGSEDQAFEPSASESLASELQESAEISADSLYTGIDYAEVFTVDPRDWGAYDSLIAEIRATADFAQREALMHQAEDMLMNTGALIPVFYDNDVYMQKEYVSGIYSNLSGCKFFRFAGTDGDTLKLQIGGEPDGLDPALCSSAEDICLTLNSFAGLYTFDEEGRAVPDLAADERVSEDGMTYTITLLPDLRWSDGSKLKASDFIYAWNRVVDPATGSGHADLFDLVARNDDGSLKAEAGEDGKNQTLTIELTAPCAYFNELLASPAWFPVKQSEAEGPSDWETDPGAWTRVPGFVTNGPYTLAAWTHGDSMTYVKNPNYHRADEVETKTLQFLLSEDADAVYTAYKQGSLDFIDTVPSEEIRMLWDNGELKTVDQLGTCYVSFHVGSPLFDGKTVAQASAMRRAFALLVDRGYLCEYIVQTRQKPANSMIPAGMADGHGGVFKGNDADYTFPDEENEGYFDPVWSQATVEEAITLLEYAGYRFENGLLSGETPITVVYLTDNDSGHMAVAEALQQDFAEIGIHMTINGMEWDAFLDERGRGNYDMVLGGCSADLNDPVDVLELWTTYSDSNDCRFGR